MVSNNELASKYEDFEATSCSIRTLVNEPCSIDRWTAWKKGTQGWRPECRAAVVSETKKHSDVTHTLQVGGRWQDFSACMAAVY